MKFKTCKNCSFTQNSADAVNCIKCGYSLPAMAEKPKNPYQLKFNSDEPKKYPCKACGFMINEGEYICLKCGYDNSKKEKPVEKQNKTISFEKFSFGSKKGFKLIPHHNVDGKELNFKDNNAIIVRDMIDSDDYSISSANHAEIKKIDGKWYIENKSSNSATFVMVDGVTELKNGSVIIIGQSKVFTFYDNEGTEK
jgi:Zn ribbon nucleic-acid-binding protein